MLFTSNLFLFVFLPVVFAGFLLAARRFGTIAAQIWLASASVIFYAYSGLSFLPLLALSIVGNYAFGRALALRAKPDGGRGILAAGVAFNLALLGYFKYGGFLDANLALLSGWSLHLPPIILPVGISFYTFTQIAFLVDARQGEAREYDFLRYTLFVTFFPHLIAGPIIHHKEMMPQFASVAANRQVFQNLAVGLFILSIGLAKKCLIADPLGAFAAPIFTRAASGQDIHFFISWSAAFAYTFQIYFDFSGYSDMAIGLARLFGVRFPANFNSPYKARSIIEFWRRWHMTLSRFLRDYLYIPLGGNRQGGARRYVNLMLVMLIGGLWHGANWTFLLWGGLHGSYLLINHAWRRVIRKSGLSSPSAITAPIYHGVTFLAVVVAWVTFRAPDISASINLYRAMFLFNGFSLPVEFEGIANTLGFSAIHFFAENSRQDFYLALVWIVGAAAIAFLVPNSLQLAARAHPTTDYFDLRTSWEREEGAARSKIEKWMLRKTSRIAHFGPLAAVGSGLLFFLAVRAMNAAAESEFLYFQF